MQLSMTQVILISSRNHGKKLQLMTVHTIPGFPACGKLKMNSSGIVIYTERSKT